MGRDPRRLPAPARQFAEANGFAAKPGACLTLPDADGQIAQVLFGLEDETSKFRDLFRPGLCRVCCRRASIASPMRPTTRGLRRWPSRSAVIASTVIARRMRPRSGWCRPTASMSPTITRMAEAAALARDLINTPSNDMGPEELAQAAQHLAVRFGANFNCIVGDDLTRQNFPLIHAVGMASPRAPRLIDLTWGDPAIPR